MNDQFARTAMLFGWENIEKLKNRRVAVFGIGGVGGHTAEALCRIGIGAIDLFDGDVVDITNINRQIIATHKTIGQVKVDVMKERLLDINPDIQIVASKLFYLPDTADEVDLTAYDYVIDAVDTMTAKLELVCRAAGLGVPIISSMGAANKLDPTALEVTDIFKTSICPMARIMRRELRKRGVKALKVVYTREVPVKPIDAELRPASHRPAPGSTAFVPSVAGLILAAEVVKDLLA
ncbi:MAG: tRNA threonylcarbamoyladenosine dehydratase [Oscillospiraceae bacterium]|nr:tRNA threonylcarbamoyladenosine dehydratase [Oscillospiraceae bacterium]